MKLLIKNIILMGAMLSLLLGAAIYGAKRPATFHKIYSAAKTTLGLKTVPQKTDTTVSTLTLYQPYKATSVLDSPSRLYPPDHQDYLDRLKEKYAGGPYISEMIKIPAGKFLMGCQNEPCRFLSLPVHEVTIESFELSTTEVTFEQWDVCVAMGGCYAMPGDLGFGRGERPVFMVTWDEVTSQFLPWLNENTEGGYRLPSEAEWEYAARSGTNTKRYWGNQDPSCDTNSPYAASWGAQPWWMQPPQPCPHPGTTMPVGSYAPNPWGLYDMLGNVHEWTLDCENNRTYFDAPTNSSSWQDGVCSRRVVRGGAWTSDLFNMRIASRKTYDKSYALERVGFRLARDIQKP